MAPEVSNPQEWARQRPQMAAEPREIVEPLETNRVDLVEVSCGTAGWLTLAAVLARGVETWAWSPWWLAGAALAVLIAIMGLVQFIALLWERRRIRQDIAVQPAGGDQ